MIPIFPSPMGTWDAVDSDCGRDGVSCLGRAFLIAVYLYVCMYGIHSVAREWFSLAQWRRGTEWLHDQFAWPAVCICVC